MDNKDTPLGPGNEKIEPYFPSFGDHLNRTMPVYGLEEDQNILWDELYDKLDLLAREEDPFDFGLPQFGETKDKLLKNLKGSFTLIRK